MEMEKLRTKFGSLPVEDVHEALADEVSIQDSLRFPVVDMRKLLDQQNPLSHRDELARLHSASKDWGFFQLINHGVQEEVIERMKNDMEEFFKLPLEKKNAYAKLSNNINEGYRQFALYEDGDGDRCDRLFLVPHPVSQRNTRSWPTHPNSFRENIDKYSWEVQKVTTCLLEFICRNLGVNPEALSSLFEDGRQSMGLNFYPPCAHADKVIGVSPHSDFNGLTLVLQLNDVQGLQIKRNGKWVPVRPIPGAFVVNIGDMIEMMSNGEYKSIEHRVVVNREKPRFSIAAFHSPRMETMVGPLPDLVKENGAKYKSMTCEEYLGRVYQQTKLDGKSLIDHMKLVQ